jgi:hypothetical protein
VYLLQADLSWLGNHKGVDLLIGGFIVLGAIALWKTIPLFIHGKKEKELAEIEAKKQAMIEENNSLIKSTSERLINIEKALTDNSQNIKSIQSEIIETQRILFEVSCDSQYSIFINEKGDIYERLKAFKNLIAFIKNGSIREAGYILIKNNMKEWRFVEKLELKVKILDQKYWDETMAYINKSIFSGV